MRKFQLFLVVEAILLVMALMTILSDDLYSFFLILVVTLLTLRFYNLGSRNNFLLTASFLLLFLIVMLNPYVIMALLLALVYMLINFFAQVKAKNRYALIQFKEEEVVAQPKANQWLGSSHPLTSDSYAFDDINIIRISGSDVIDLDQVILTGRDNVIVVRKIYGPTQIRVPIDVAVSAHVSAVYGSLSFLDLPDYDLRNESLKLTQPGYERSHRTVKLILSVIAGRVEVVRS